MAPELKPGNLPPAEGNGQAGNLSPAKQALLELRRKQKQKAAAPGGLAIPRRAERTTAPLSFAQERLWLLDQMEPGSPAYSVPRLLRLRGPLDTAALQRALDALVARHEILRTTYPAEGGVPVQRIDGQGAVELYREDMRGRPEAEVQRLLADAMRRPFDLTRDAMLRAGLVRVADDEYLLLLVSHHIASDGWSGGILLRELAELYRTCGAGRPSDLPELPVQYADFAAWQRDGVRGERLEQQLGYWRQQLAGMPALLELPTDRPRPATQSSRGATHYAVFPPALLDDLRRLSQREGVTLFMTLLAAFKTLLGRYAGQTDVVVGTPISGRNRVETEPLIGDFVNMLVLRTGLAGNPPFRELLRRVRATALAAYEHSEVPFEKLVAELQPARALSHSPLFQVMFILGGPPPEAPAFAGLEAQLLPVNTGTSKHDLILGMAETARGLRVELEYATDLFDAETIARMVGHLRRLLEGIVANPAQPLGDLPLLPEDERRQSLVEWNATEADFPRDRCIHELFAAQARQAPEAPAVWFEGRRLSYRELNERANRLAHYLRKQGVGPEVRVGLYVERSPEMVVGLLGILKAGGAYVPLDPTLPEDRLAFLMEDAQAPVLLTQERLRDRLSRQAARTVCLDADWGQIECEGPEDPGRSAAPENLAYVIFTSGSTGRPKGVELPHRAVVNFLHHMHRRPGMAAGDTHLGVATMSFDASVLDFFVPLTGGACLAVVGREAVTDGRLLAGQMAASGATVMHATPSTWRLLLESGWPGDRRLKILAGGEALPWELARELLARVAEVWNLYGPTETAVYSTVHRLAPADGRVLVGRPIANTRVYLLDRYGRPAPVGAPGEVCIGGAGVSRGYLNRPELTAEKYVPDGFGGQPGARLYRTGDLGRYRAGGVLECLGRIDHQVKIRGFRIELGEIEAVLRQHPAVQEAVVLAREDVPGDKRLAAYVVPAPGPAPAARELRAFLQEKLPDYMVPTAFVTLETLPLSPNGKVNRSVLPKPEETGLVAEEAYVPPSTPVEETLAGIWAAALGKDRVGARDNFFDLGGHSLLAAQVVARVRDAFQLDLPMRTLFETPVLGDMARGVEQSLVRDADPDEMAALLAQLEGS